MGYKMKGSPFQRNFGIGSPLKQKKKNGDEFGKITPKQYEASMDTIQAALHSGATTGSGQAIKGWSRPAWKKSHDYLNRFKTWASGTFSPTAKQVGRSVKRVKKYLEQSKNK